MNANRMMTIEEICDNLRKKIKQLEQHLVLIMNHPETKDETRQLDGPNIPSDKISNIKENTTLVFRHLEDARMRLGKVMQAYQGGVSILDRTPTKGE